VSRSDAAGVPTILLVDDTPINLQVLVQILEGSGYRLLVARNGRSALDIARRARPNLILLDIAMPGMDGFEVMRTLRQDPASRDIVVIFLSALGDPTDKVTGLELGAADYITKPFQAEEVLARIAGQLERQRLEREVRHHRDRLERELEAAGEMQRRLLPAALPGASALAFAAHYRASLHAGGDYYDVLDLGAGRTGVIVVDVSGHGARAAVIMAMVRTLVHTWWAEAKRPAELLLRLNRHFDYFWATGMFATAVCAVFEPARGRVRISVAGHPPPLLARGGCAKALECAGSIPLFLQDLAEIGESEHDLSAGDRLVFYSDGIMERENAVGEMYGVERLADAVVARADFSPQEIVAHVVGELDGFVGGGEPEDDLTLVVTAVERASRTRARSAKRG
jgi:phosphoserine phosphatase RsbU/P